MLFLLYKEDVLLTFRLFFNFQPIEEFNRFYDDARVTFTSRHRFSRAHNKQLRVSIYVYVLQTNQQQKTCIFDYFTYPNSVLESKVNTRIERIWNSPSVAFDDKTVGGNRCLNGYLFIFFRRSISKSQTSRVS